MKKYYYGMRLRGYAPMCQPKEGCLGIAEEYPHFRKKYHDIIAYNRELSAKECWEYDLDYLGVTEE